MDLKPIPAFYCCYLLRSTVRHKSLYVGSTPNPVRRLAQHNGLTKGGAKRTARNNLRPWEMSCIVTGFPSSIAALQFEWAWQNTSLTRRIDEDQRVTFRITKASSKAGRTRKIQAQPTPTLQDKLCNLHLLLRVPSFARWPLEVRFYNEDVYEAWLQWSPTANAPLSSSTNIILDFPRHSNAISKDEPSRNVQANGKSKSSALPSHGIESVDATYAPLKDHLEKSLFLLAEDEVVQCSVCNKNISIPVHMTVVCPGERCRAASHMTCLSQKFLAEEGSSGLIPVTGSCPKCRKSLRWVDLVKEATLRLRGEKETARLMKKPRRRKGEEALAGTISEDEAEDSDDSDLSEYLRAEDVADEPLRHDVDNDSMSDFDDASSVVSQTSTYSRLTGQARSPAKPPFKIPPGLDIVIEDSEWEDAEALD